MILTIDLAARYAAAFGVIAANKAIDKAFVSRAQDKEYDLKYYPFQKSDFEYIKFELQSSGLEPLEFSSVLHGATGSIFAPPLIIDFSQEKSLIETEVNDDDPVVIERWGTKPWDITIRGLLIDLEHRIYPGEQINRLNQNWKRNQIVKVVGRQFVEDLDIDSIYFRSVEFTRIEGYQDTVQFTINASSIKAVNFTLLKVSK